jgi:hypothetical protein
LSDAAFARDGSIHRRTDSLNIRAAVLTNGSAASAGKQESARVAGNPAVIEP